VPPPARGALRSLGSVLKTAVSMCVCCPWCRAQQWWRIFWTATTCASCWGPWRPWVCPTQRRGRATRSLLRAAEGASRLGGGRGGASWHTPTGGPAPGQRWDCHAPPHGRCCGGRRQLRVSLEAPPTHLPTPPFLPSPPLHHCLHSVFHTVLIPAQYALGPDHPCTVYHLVYYRR